MHAYVINITVVLNNLPCYPPDSHQSYNAVYWRTGTKLANESLTHELEELIL